MEKKTKSITVTQFDYILRNGHDEEIDIDGHTNHYREFDPDGRPLKEIKYNNLGEFEEMFEYEYDAQGLLIREAYYPVENEVAEEKTFISNDTGQIIRVLKHYRDGSIDTIEYEYNVAGELARRTTTSDEGEIEQVETFEWENGELVNHQIFDEDGDLISDPDLSGIKQNESRVTHNDKGQVITEEEIDEHGEVYLTINRSYHDDGLAAEVDVQFDGRGQTISRHYFLKYEYTFFE
ncbi:MAG: hypothetical protein Q8M08_08245 [Bacteroidales bacterium]|nr:hypothetical protein [Bacteroidales bacterium]